MIFVLKGQHVTCVLNEYKGKNKSIINETKKCEDRKRGMYCGVVSEPALSILKVRGMFFRRGL